MLLGTMPNSDTHRRVERDIAAIIAIRRRLLAAGLPIRAVHVLIYLGFEEPSDVRSVAWLDQDGSRGLRSLMLRSRNCGLKTIALTEQWLTASGQIGSSD